MTPNEYQNFAMCTNDGKETERVYKALEGACIDVGGVINGCLGLS